MEANVQEFLEHFGVKGMRWGVRRDDRSGTASKSTSREARKDAEEFARAKLYYGKGAGTRRKLIKATVEAKSKKDSAYAKAFDAHLSNQDLSTHASKARTERKRTDRKEKTKQRAGFVARRATGEMGTQAAFVAATIAGGAYLRSPRGRAMMNKAASSVKNFSKSQQAKKTTDFLTNYFKGQ